MNIHVNASEIPKEAILGIRDAFIQKEMVDRTIMDEGFRYAFKSCWGMKNAPCVVGVAQELSRYSYPAYLSHIRRINTPLPASAKMRAPHALHPSTWGYTCPVETPDGRNVGVRKNFSVAARITVGLATPPIEALCGDIGMIPLGRALLHLHSSDSHSGLGTPILINEKMVGYIWNAVEFVTTFRALRRRGVIHPYISISLRNSLTKKSVVISTDDGRPIRPLIVIDPETNKAVAEYPQGLESIAYLCTGRRDVTDIDFFSIERIVDTEHLKQWKENSQAYMESNTGGIIEYIDPQEQDNCLIAMSEEDVTMKDQVVRRFSHSEIHPSLILGILGLNIPFT
jgi:DNA-directed RNA polymerase beta subunit